MDFIPRHAQPFTFAEAVKLDVPVITEEITRLQNSLHHLKQTQYELQEYVTAEAPENADTEITKALQENETVIGSQEERILMLKLALSEKGVHYNSHYDLNTGSTRNPDLAAAQSQSVAESVVPDSSQVESMNEEGGIRL